MRALKPHTYRTGCQQNQPENKRYNKIDFNNCSRQTTLNCEMILKKVGI